MADIIVAVICNLIAALILFSGVITAINNSWRIALSKFIIMILGGVGCYFAVPALSNYLLGIQLVAASDIQSAMLLSDLLLNIGISLVTFNSTLFTILFLIVYSFDIVFCNILRHKLINSYKNNRENKAKIKRAKSINPKAERLAKRAAWRGMRDKYRANNSIGKKIISIFISSVAAIILGIIVLMPFGYIAEDINKVADGSKSYLETGFDYTLNGIIDEKIDFKFFDWLVSAYETSDDGEPENPESQQPCEHTFVDGICEICGESEVPEVTE